MVKMSYSPEFDQHDPKKFRETLGTFGTTTKPGANQLQELQTKVRQGVKHVELVLWSRGKGQFGAMDVPDKYGFKERKTIMQLAKLNQQTLSVHASGELVSFSGFDGRSGFNETHRWENIKEMDETLNFAAQTAKGGAVVTHFQGDPIQTSRGISLSSNYLKWLKKNRPEEYERVKKDYFNKNPLDSLFVDNPEKADEIYHDYRNLDENRRKKFEEEHKDEITGGKKPWEIFYLENQIEKRKLAPDLNPFVVVGDSLAQVDRKQEFVDFNVLKKGDFSNEEKKVLDKIGVGYGKDISLDDFQKAFATFTNGKPNRFKDISEGEFKNLQNKLLMTYEKVLEQNEFMQSQADADFFKKLNKMQLNLLDLQKKQLETKYVMFKDEIERIKVLEKENKEALAKIDKLNGDTPEEKAVMDAIKIDIAMRNKDLQNLKYYSVGQEDFHVLSNFDEQVAEINRKKKDLKKQIDNARSFSDESFDRNVSALGYLGIKAMKYQLDMKKKSKEAESVLPKLQGELESLETEYEKTTDTGKQDELAEKIAKKRSEVNNWVGAKDYSDIDLINNPLYVAPENMLPGMGSLASVEEFKAAVRMAQEDFANKILNDNDDSFKQIRSDYERVTGVKINTKEDAMKLAKRHLAGTFDSAHAGSWLKHFKRNKGESEESRLERFNDWLNSQAEDMAREGLIKHVHFNDTTGKDDDHNLPGSGVLNLHDLRKRLRNVGIKEAFIVEAGGRGPDKNFQLMSAFDLFNPQVGYKLDASLGGGTSVSDWVSVKRDYNNRPQYSGYGFSESTFRVQQPQQGQERGGWSGTGFF